MFSKINFKKEYFLIFLFFGLAFGFSAAAATCQTHNVAGYAWSENIGWISMSCANNTDIGAGVDYGVDIDSDDGEFSGYAWSENIGWIDFEPSGSYPDPPNHSVEVDFDNDNEISGWARALSYGDGWDGWIKMRNHNSDPGPDYGVWLDESVDPVEFKDWAWGSDIVGWISFNGANYKATTTVSSNRAPDKPGIDPSYPDGESWNHCSVQGISVPTLHWTYSDPDSDPQESYEIRMNDSSSFPPNPGPGELTDSGGVSTAYAPIPSTWSSWSDWNSNFWWIARVKDDQGNWSEWSDSNKFKTNNHAYPYPDFSWTPEDPSQGEIVNFDSDPTQTYNGVSTYLWTITQGDGNYVDSTSNVSQYPYIIFSTQDNKIKLAVTDSDGYSCESSEKDVTAQLPLPEYKEVPPTSWIKKLFAGLAGLFYWF